MSWTLISSQTLTTTSSAVVFGNGNTIPQTYKTLKFLISARSTNTGVVYDSMYILFNTDSYSLPTERGLWGDGTNRTTATGGGTIHIYTPAASATASTHGNIEITIPLYATGSITKPFVADSVTENNATAAYQSIVAASPSTTSAITQIELQSNASWAAQSTFTLYGLK